MHRLEQGLRHMRVKWKEGVFYSVIFIALYLCSFLVKRYGDDWAFFHYTEDLSLLAFMRTYRGISGRIFSTAFAYLFVGGCFELWRALNVVMLMACAYGLVRIVKREVRPGEFMLALSLYLTLHTSILWLSTFWASGSVNYLWPVTAALWLLVPFADAQFRGAEKPRCFPLLLIAAMVAGGSNEQVALCVVCFMLAFLLSSLQRRRRIHPQYLVLFLVSLAFLALMALGEGNANRYEAELRWHFPELATYSLGRRLMISVQWMADRLFGHLGFFVVFLYALFLYAYLRKEKTSRYVTAALAAPLALLVMAPFLLQEQAFRLLLTFDELIGSPLNYIAYLLWGGMACAVFLWLCKASPFCALCLCAVVASHAVMLFSPTMYASGYRTSLVGAVLCILVVLWMLPEGRGKQTLTLVMPCIAVVNLLYFFLKVYEV